MNHINEVSRLKPEQLTSKGSQRYWALYASFYEKIFQKIDNIEDLKDSYQSRLKSGELSGEAKDAMTFFYRIRRDELDDPKFWNKLRENKKENMKIVAESLNESMSRYCAFYKASDGQWYMELADSEYAEYDEATTYGPFSSEEKADEYLHNNFSNPGGMDYDDSGDQEPPTVSPNGRPVVRPSSGGRFNTMRSMGFR